MRYIHFYFDKNLPCINILVYESSQACMSMGFLKGVPSVQLIVRFCFIARHSLIQKPGKTIYSLYLRLSFHFYDHSFKGIRLFTEDPGLWLIRDTKLMQNMDTYLPKDKEKSTG